MIKATSYRQEQLKVGKRRRDGKGELKGIETQNKVG
jgi:hypothetical protein